MTTQIFLARFALLAQADDGPPWWLFPLMGVAGLVMIVLGAKAAITKRVVLRGRQKLFWSLFGISEFTGAWAVILGSIQCIAGVLFLLVAVSGPFWAGFLADDEPSGSADAQQLGAAFPAFPPNTGDPQPPAAPPAIAAPSDEQAGQPSSENPPAPALRAGSNSGQPYADAAPAGGVLVGLRLAQGKNWGGALQAVQPIYQVGTGYAIGARQGKEGGEEQEVIARPGYAVGAINARAGLVLNAVQLVFYRVNQQRLDPNDQYASDWIGCEGGGPSTLDGKGGPITGIFGTWQDDLVSIGINRVEALETALAPPTEPPPDLWGEPRAGTILGTAKGAAFRDVAPEGGVLVGLRGFCDNEPQLTLRSLQPIYLVGDRYVEGERHGEGGDQEFVTVARHGYRVGGMAFTELGDVAGLRLTYVPLASGSADGKAPYPSPWLGFPFDHIKQEAATGERFAVGLIVHGDEYVRGVGLVLQGGKNLNVSAAAVLPADLQKAAYARPRQRAGDPGGEAFTDAAPAGGLLVGLRCFQGTNWGGALRAVQPVYQVGTEQRPGGRYGKPGGDETQLLARPGYAVGAINARAGLVLNAVQVVFYRVDGLRLHPSDQYATAWVGSDGGSSYTLDGKGDPIVGVFGSSEEDMISLGIEPIEQLEPLDAFASAAAVPADPQPKFRTWTSADGKFTVEAKLVTVEGNQVKLERRDGSVVTVPLEKLSEADAALIRAATP